MGRWLGNDGLGKFAGHFVARHRGAVYGAGNRGHGIAVALKRSSRWEADLEALLEYAADWIMSYGQSIGWPAATLLYQVMKTGGASRGHGIHIPYVDIPARVEAVARVLARLPEEYVPIISARYFTPVQVIDGTPKLTQAVMADLLGLSRTVFLARLREAHAWVAGAMQFDR